MTQSTEQKQTHRGQGVKDDRVWDKQMQTIIYTMDKQ